MGRHEEIEGVDGRPTSVRSNRIPYKGDEVEGTVERIIDHDWAIVRCDWGICGRVHITELGWEFVSDIRDLLGKQVKVRVIDRDYTHSPTRILFSLRTWMKMDYMRNFFKSNVSLGMTAMLLATALKVSL